jgi:septum formation protein
MSGDAREVAVENALRKATAARREGSGELVLGVDTVVTLDGGIYGKPGDADSARTMLRALSARTHLVVSGLALLGDDREDVATATTEVTFRALPEALIDWYLATGEWRERAGGYAIQGAGAALVTRVAGDYENVVGLPVGTLIDLCPTLLLERETD